MGALPGWYPDPSGTPGQRYFDGTSWTEHRTAASPQPAKSKAWLWVLVLVPVLLFGGCATLLALGPRRRLGAPSTRR